MANLSLRGSVLHSSFHVSFLLRAFSHRSQLHCAFRLTTLVFRFSSSCCRISDWTSSLRKSSEAFFQLACVMNPSLSLPLVTIPAKSLCLSLSSASFSASAACHFLPVFTLILTVLTFLSRLFRYVAACRILETLNSPTKEISGSWSMFSNSRLALCRFAQASSISVSRPRTCFSSCSQLPALLLFL